MALHILFGNYRVNCVNLWLPMVWKACENSSSYSIILSRLKLRLHYSWPLIGFDYEFNANSGFLMKSIGCLIESRVVCLRWIPNSGEFIQLTFLCSSTIVDNNDAQLNLPRILIQFLVAHSLFLEKKSSSKNEIFKTYWQVIEKNEDTVANPCCVYRFPIR